MTDPDAPTVDDPPWVHTLYLLIHAFVEDRSQ